MGGRDAIMLRLDCIDMPKRQLDYVIKDYIIYLYEVAKENKVDSISIFNSNNVDELYEFTFPYKHSRNCIFKCGLFSAIVSFSDMDRVGALSGFFKDRQFVIGKIGK